MPRLAKTRLRQVILDALKASGYSIEQAGTDHPFAVTELFTGTYQQAVAQYGQVLVDRVNFSNGRVKPSLAMDASAGAKLMQTDNLAMNFQVDAQNLNDRIDLIDFAGLFSGNPAAPPRSWDARLRFSF